MISYLNKEGVGKLYRDLATAVQKSKAAVSPAFVYAEQEFNMPQFMGDQHGVNAVNESGAVLFEIGGSDSYDYSDAYYRTLGTRVVMTASLKKFTRIAGAGKMGAISHDAIYFSGRKGKKVPLAVFGYIVTIKGFAQLKPYAIWLPTGGI